MEKTLLGPLGPPTRKPSSPIIMQSFTHSDDPLIAPFESLNMHAYSSDIPSIHLLDETEKLLIPSEATFTKALRIGPTEKVKVVSIFGNTGEVFPTSTKQKSCTMGVWAMYNPNFKAICLDTEGLLGVSKKEHQRTRLLLKTLAVSDVIIFRTKAERLQRDMYTFLGSASKAFKEHFSAAIEQVLRKNGVENPPDSLGPALVIFHEPNYAETLNCSTSETDTAEDLIRSNFNELGLTYGAFSSIKYVGVRSGSGSTSFHMLREALLSELECTKVRSARDPKYVYLTLKGVNEKFQCQITDTSPHLYLPAFFTCRDKCQSCDATCILSMGHKDDKEPHVSNDLCRYQHQFENFVYICKKCHENGQRQVVKTSYKTKTESLWTSFVSSVWSGYVIECPVCGVIYRSREYWYGNADPTSGAVLKDNVHVWPGETSMFGTYNSAQKVLDGVTSLTNVVASVGSQPTKLISDWVTDQIAPPYWKPNSEITECYKCKSVFPSNASKHHCRACGEGFCEACSSKTQEVPSRGWNGLVRVCDYCYLDPENSSPAHSTQHPPTGATEVRARIFGETVINTVSAVTSVMKYPKDLIKDSARPTYWTPDSECINCSVCKKPFGSLLVLHHCRDCGKGVCDRCSNSRKPVPLRGWDSPVRVCNHCLT